MTSLLSLLFASPVVTTRNDAARHFTRSGVTHGPSDVAFNVVTNAYHSRITRAVVFAGQPV